MEPQKLLPRAKERRLRPASQHRRSSSSSVDCAVSSAAATGSAVVSVPSPRRRILNDASPARPLDLNGPSRGDSQFVRDGQARSASYAPQVRIVALASEPMTFRHLRDRKRPSRSPRSSNGRRGQEPNVTDRATEDRSLGGDAAAFRSPFLLLVDSLTRRRAMCTTTRRPGIDGSLQRRCAIVT